MRILTIANYKIPVNNCDMFSAQNRNLRKIECELICLLVNPKYSKNIVDNLKIVCLIRTFKPRDFVWETWETMLI